MLVPSLLVELWPARAKPPGVPVALPSADTARRYAVYVADWGYHTSIIVEQPEGWAMGPAGREARSASPFVEYAWGDRMFYMESRYDPFSVTGTLFLPTEAVAYVEGWSARPEQAARGARALFRRDVGGDQLVLLVAELERWIVREAGPHPARVSPHPPARGYRGRFYPAHGRYLWFNDCNRWTVERLAAIDAAEGGRGVLFSGQVAGRLRGFTRLR